jgi:putative heme-binding domain-containing protein
VIIRWLSGGHNGCTLAFGKDGYLYISTGDAADPDPPDSKRKTGQDNRDFLACILRIDIDKSDGTNAYAVPADNPFLNMADVRPEIWAFGFRNPFRMSFDQPTGDLWVGDVGWEQWEMIYRVQRGGNYGWALREGPNTAVRRDIQQGPGPILPPVVSLPHSDAASITGGFVYHGRKIPKLNGAYLYGDWETGKFWALRHRNGVLQSNDELCDTALKPVAFALTRESELLILDYNGGLYEFASNEAPATAGLSFPRRLRQTGLFASIQPLLPAPGTIVYRIAAPMWNDHAIAEWLLAIPGNGVIQTSGGVGNIAGETWAFPTNTVLARTLSLELEAGHPASLRRIETQLLHWDGQAWNPYSYQWRSDQSDADLVGNAGTNVTFFVNDPSAPGGKRSTPWRFMTRAECLRCHNAWAGEALTLNWLQLGSPDAEESQISQLVALDALRLRNAPGTVEPLAYPYDDSFTIAERARSWLHVNCSACHRLGAGGAVSLHLNYEKRLAETRAVDVKPARGDFSLTEARIIAPGDPYRSTLFYRINTGGAGRMPHIGSRLPDPDGINVVRDWIQSLVPLTNNSPDDVVRLAADIQRQLGRLHGPARNEAIGALHASMNGSLALLSRVDTSPELRRVVVQSAAVHTNYFVRDLYQHLLPESERRVTVGNNPDPQAILALTGDGTRGRKVFNTAAQCTQCHPMASDGQKFGPDLAGIRSKYSRAQLLTQILQPSESVAPEFKLTSVTTKDGRELNGFVIRRMPGAIVLKEQSLTEHTLESSQIAELRESSLSAMPEGLLAPLTAQEVADLLEFLLQ